MPPFSTRPSRCRRAQRRQNTRHPQELPPMNAPLPESIRKALETVSLDDKYALESGRAFMSGVQALVRLPMLQRKRDAMAGLNTAGFISGYRGPPPGTYDHALWPAQKPPAPQNITCPPGGNQ